MADRLPDPSKRIYFDRRCPAKLHKSNCYFYDEGKCSFNGIHGTCIYDAPNYQLDPIRGWGEDPVKTKNKKKR